MSIHHLVVVEEAFSYFEVPLFDFFLGPFNTARDHRVFDRLAVFHSESGQNILDPVPGEDANQLVFERKEELCLTGIPLSAASPAQLEVDSPCLVPFGSDDVQPPQLADFVPLFFHLFGRFDLADLSDPFVTRHVEPGRVFVLED